MGMFTGTADEEQASGEDRSELLGRLAYIAMMEGDSVAAKRPMSSSTSQSKLWQTGGGTRKDHQKMNKYAHKMIKEREESESSGAVKIQSAEERLDGQSYS